MSVNPSQNLIRFEDSILETKLVAMIRQEPSKVTMLSQVEFTESFDDLDYLTFAILTLPSQNRVSLVRHQNSPQSGTEICVRYDQSDIALILQEALTQMNLSLDDITWIHSEYEQQLNELYKSFQSAHRKKKRSEVSSSMNGY